MAIVLPDLMAIGAQRYALGIAKRLTRFNIEYCVLLQNGGGEFANEVPGQLRRVFGYRIFSGIRGIRTIESLVRLALLLRRGHFDYIYCISPFLNRIACFLKLIGIVRAKVVIEEHGYPPRYLSPDDGMSLLWVWFYQRTFWLYRSASSIRVISDGILDFYHQIGLRENVVFFPNLIDLARIARLGAEVPSHSLRPGAKNILYFGRLGVQKNVTFLIEAFAKLAQGMNAYLTLIGRGEEEAKLKELASRLGVADRVVFLGFLENPYPLIKTADVMALTSIWEGAPQVLVEAMALGTAVVARDCPTGPSEMLGRNSERGWLVPYDSGPEEFSLSLRQALENGEMKARRAAAAKEFAFREYDIDQRLQEQVALFFGQSGSKQTERRFTRGGC